MDFLLFCFKPTRYNYGAVSNIKVLPILFVASDMLVLSQFCFARLDAEVFVDNKENIGSRALAIIRIFIAHITCLVYKYKNLFFLHFPINSPTGLSLNDLINYLISI